MTEKYSTINPHILELSPQSELFKGSEIYYSGSIKGKLLDPLIGYELVRYMLENGAEVPSAHVAARNPDEMLEVFTQRSGEGINESGEDMRGASMLYRVDMGWVDQSNRLVAVVDGASHGVGMEVMRALLKFSRGLERTPVLCLISEQNLEFLPNALKAASYEFGRFFKLAVYESSEQAKQIVKEFLSRRIVLGAEVHPTQECVDEYRELVMSVDKANYLIEDVNQPDHLTGLRIMRALSKPQRGLPLTPVLCLASADKLSRVSWMITGAGYEFGDNIKVVGYRSEDEKFEIMKKFAMGVRD